jgi:hypothetical protein
MWTALDRQEFLSGHQNQTATFRIIRAGTRRGMADALMSVFTGRDERNRPNLRWPISMDAQGRRRGR